MDHQEENLSGICEKEGYMLFLRVRWGQQFDKIGRRSFFPIGWGSKGRRGLRRVRGKVILGCWVLKGRWIRG